jgi:hypothetical protein
MEQFQKIDDRRARRYECTFSVNFSSKLLLSFPLILFLYESGSYFCFIFFASHVPPRVLQQIFRKAMLCTVIAEPRCFSTVRKPAMNFIQGKGRHYERCIRFLSVTLIKLHVYKNCAVPFNHCTILLIVRRCRQQSILEYRGALGE